MGRMVWLGLSRNRSNRILYLLPFAAKLNDLAPVPLGRAALRGGSELHEGSSLFCKLDTHFTAGVCLAIEGLSHFGGATDVADGKDVDLKLAALVGDLETVAHLDVPGRFDGLAIGPDPAKFTSTRGKSPGLEEPGGP